MVAGSASGVHWKQFIAECEATLLPLGGRMWNWERLPNRNPIFLQSPRLPLYKEKLRILTKLRKVESKTKRFSFFLPRRRICATLCTFRSKNFLLQSSKKVRKKREKNKTNLLYFSLNARAYNSGQTEKEVTLLPLLTPNSRAEGAEGTHKKGITLLYARVGEERSASRWNGGKQYMRW
jgi:hypothetical protein